MASVTSGLFLPVEFRNRGVLRLAPDAFIAINGALGARIVSPLDAGGNKDLEVRGGVTSINVNLALNPPGASKATIEVVAPQYKGLHEDYYVNLPNGTKIPYFSPMMEVKIYMKGRFLDESDGYKPQYYPVFWGMITEVSETYSGGMNTFSIGCQDILCWWKYQKITIKPSWSMSQAGGPTANKFPTVFENMTPWEIIYTLFLDNFFVNEKDERYDFLYPQYSSTGIPPDFGQKETKDGKYSQTFSALTHDVIKYWNARFGFGVEKNFDKANRIPLEMWGLQGPIHVESVRAAVNAFRETGRMDRKSNIHKKLDLDYGLLSRIQPYGAFNLYGDASSSIVYSKLEIANEVCEQTHMEFFMDTNGKFVFKPPLYNLDTNSESLPYYIFSPEDIISFGSSVNSDGIVNFLEVTCPARQEIPSAIEVKGYHVDFESVKKFGVRFQELKMRYGSDPQSLRLVACAEITRVNGRCFTGNLSTPLRPEIRLGYPIYIKHIDAYYYVTSITHSLTFGSAATTDLGLEFRRDRVWDDGSVTGKPGTLLKKKVYRFKPQVDIEALKAKAAPDGTTAEKIKEWVDKLKATLKEENADDEQIQVLMNDMLKEDFMRNSGMLSGPKNTGLYEVSDASIRFVTSNKTGDFVKENQNKVDQQTSADEKKTPDEAAQDKQGEEISQVVSNELLMITDDTVPYTDRLGYRHIGAFPYGANLKLTRGKGLIDLANPEDIKIEQTETVVNASGTEKAVSTKNTKESGKPKAGYLDFKSNDSLFQPTLPSTTSVASVKQFENTVNCVVDAKPKDVQEVFGGFVTTE